MKIKIEHLSNTFNYGSCMMGITLINALINEFGENIKIYLDTESEEDLARVKKELGYESLFKDENSYKVTGRNKIEKIINYKKAIRKNINKFDCIIIIGGDDISEYYGNVSLMLELYKINEYSKNLSVFLVGQTIGPFTGVRKKLARHVLNKVTIYARDDKCIEYSNSIGITSIIKGRDLAFLKLPNMTNADSILDKYNIRKRKYITVVPSGLYKLYTSNREIYIENQVEIVKKLLINKSINNVNIVLLPHVLLPKDVDDRKIINAISERLSEKEKERLIFVDESMLPSEARVILGNGIFTITGRMHAAVSTFFMRKPALSLSYSIKYEGVISKGINMKELVIEASDDVIWRDKIIGELVNEKVNYIMEKYDELIDKIDRNVSDTSEITSYELNDLILKIKNKFNDRI